MDHREAVKEARRQLDELRASETQANQRLRAAVLQAVESGAVSLRETAKLANVTRATVYNWRNGGPGNRPS